MGEESRSIERRLERITDRLTRIEHRLDAIDGGSQAPSAFAEEVDSRATADQAAPAGEVSAAGLHGAETVPLIGRTLVVVAGAFLIRALTDRGVLPDSAGVALGLVYALAWIVMAELAGRVDRRRGAIFHGLAASVIAYPLLWEATAKFGFLTAEASAAALAVVSGLALWVAWHQRLRALAWMAAVGGTGTALVLAASSRQPVLFGGVLLALGAATLWLGYLRGWSGLAWSVAAVVDGFLALIGAMVLKADPTRVEEILRPSAVVWLLLGLVVVYVGSLAVRTLRSGHDLSTGEIVQGSAAVAIGVGGALAVTRAAGLPEALPGILTLLLGFGCYGASFAVIDRQAGGRRNFVFFSTAALLLTLAAGMTFLPAGILAVAMAVVAVAVAWLGARHERATLSLHGAVYVTAAAITSGMLASSLNALVGGSVPAGDWINLPVLTVLAASLVYCWFGVATHGRTWGRFSRVPKAIVIAVVVLVLDGIAVTLGSRLLGVVTGGPVEATTLAPLRTGVLALSAVLLALAGRLPRLDEARWLVYPFLVAGGLKLAAEDLRTGRPATLFVSLGLFGAALILAPRLNRKG